MRIAVVGGGASGMCAALAASEKGHEITLFERNSVLGKKLLMTGNGRCNLGNEDFDIKRIGKYYHGDLGVAENVLGTITPSDVTGFFEMAGICLRSINGYLYPYSEQAVSVRDALAFELSSRGVRVETNVKITGIEVLEKGFELILGYEDGSMERETFDRCILACGSRAVPKTGSDGFGYKLCKKLSIPVRKPLPALTRLYFEDDVLPLAAGVRAKGELTLYIDDEEAGKHSGEIQFLKNAVSGIAAFQLSSSAARALDENKKVLISADLFPGEGEAALFDRLYSRFKDLEHRTLLESFTGFLNLSLAKVIILKAGLDVAQPSLSASDTDIRKLAGLIKGLDTKVIRTGGFDECQVCSGGITGDALTDKLMIKDIPGLYAAGELLDVDGICGGYNLTFAAASGILAAQSASV
ncbi:MAG: aminoacetone oxidase family FAD-binding enzyme [Lachnospiraceae bacterium]|nr:aminoacetone oxidase family FAD-binding enzyme [Lachnospiraceae bacterium]